MPAFELNWVHLSGGTPLEIEGTYIFSAPMDENCKPEKGWEIWSVERHESGLVDRRCPFGVVRVYRLPENAFVMRYLPQWLWQSLDERLDINVGGTSVKYSFEINWHKTTTPLWRMSTIT